ncbi:5307_t:CDS:2, partial [Scutellospora calospora]
KEQIQESSKHQTQQRINTRRPKHQTHTIPDKEQIQESPKHKTQRRTNTKKKRKFKALFLVKNKHKKVQSTKPGEEQTQEKRESPKLYSYEEQTQERRECLKYLTQQKTNTRKKRKSEALFLAKNLQQKKNISSKY